MPAEMTPIGKEVYRVIDLGDVYQLLRPECVGPLINQHSYDLRVQSHLVSVLGSEQLYSRKVH